MRLVRTAAVRPLSPSLQLTQALLGLRERNRRADVHPYAVHAHAVGAAPLDRPRPYLVEREGSLGGIIEQAGMRDRHAREGERHDLLLCPPAADAPVGCEGEIAAPLVAVAARGQRQHQETV